MHWAPVQREEAAERVSLTQRPLIRVRPIPPHSSSPQPKAPPHVGALPQPIRANIEVPAISRTMNGRTSHRASPALGIVKPQGLPSPKAPVKPTPLSSAASQAPTNAPCEKSNQPAAIADKVLPVISKSAREAGTSGIARVHVMLSETAVITGAKLVDSSQNHELDLEALAAARASTYSPATRSCKPVAGEADYAVQFVSL